MCDEAFLENVCLSENGGRSSSLKKKLQAFSRRQTRMVGKWNICTMKIKKIDVRTLRVSSTVSFQWPVRGAREASKLIF